MVMVLMVYGSFVALWRLWCNLQEKKGVATFFLPGCCPFPQGLGGFRASSVFVGTAEVRALYVQKHNLHNTKQKTGVIPQGAKKWVLGMSFAYRFGDVRLINHV